MLQANLKRRSSKPRLCFRVYTTLPPVPISDPAEERGLTPSADTTWLIKKSPEQRAASAASTGKKKITKANPSPQPEHTRASILKRNQPLPVPQLVTVTTAGIYSPTLAFSGFLSLLDFFDIRCFILSRLISATVAMSYFHRRSAKSSRRYGDTVSPCAIQTAGAGPRFGRSGIRRCPTSQETRFKGTRKTMVRRQLPAPTTNGTARA